MAETSTPDRDWRSILALVLSALGVVFFLGMALILVATWFLSYSSIQPGLTQGLPIGLFIWSAIFDAALLLPILITSIYQVRGQPIPRWLDTRQPFYRKLAGWGILFFPLMVVVGWFIFNRSSADGIFLGPINILVASIPVLWIYNVAQKELSGGSQTRKWRIFGFSLTVTPLIIILFEVIAIVFLVVIIGIWLRSQISLNPQLQQDLLQLFDQVKNSNGDLDAVSQLIEPYLRQPSFIFLGLAMVAGLIPMIEELLKTIALWPLASDKITPQEGFVGGLLCGAGFALMENVLYFTNVFSSEDWIFMAFSRAGTGVIHMLASGLMGWGLAKAWSGRKWKFLCLTTLLAILVHSLWNALALISGVVLVRSAATMPSWKSVLVNLPILLLLILSSVAVLRINHFLRKPAVENLTQFSEVEQAFEDVG